MTPFRPTFNIFVPLIKVIIIAIILKGYIVLIPKFVRNAGFEEFKYKEVYAIIFLALVIGTFLIMIIWSLFMKTKNYTFTDTFIKQYNFLVFSSIYYHKDDILGFSKNIKTINRIPYSVLKLHLCDQTTIELQQYEYFNFSRIAFELYERGYAELAAT